MRKAFLFVLCLTFNSYAYGDQFRNIPGKLKHISESMNHIWGINTANKIFRCVKPCAGKWINVPGGLVQLDLGDMEVWGVNARHQIYKRSITGSGKWVQVRGGLKHVSASGNGYIWGVTGDNTIFKCKKPCSGQWIRVPGHLKQLDAGERYVYGVNKNNQVFGCYSHGKNGDWKLVSSKKMRYVSVGSRELFGVDLNSELFRCKLPCVGEWERIEIPCRAFLTQADASVGEIAVVSSRNRIYVRTLD